VGGGEEEAEKEKKAYPVPQLLVFKTKRGHYKEVVGQYARGEPLRGKKKREVLGTGRKNPLADECESKERRTEFDTGNKTIVNGKERAPGKRKTRLG